ncbi:MAG: hypothetical protein SFV53_04715 [Rickettsiales bacterium]|nr:hypothetical protein [Rickettsiales bacterium]
MFSASRRISSQLLEVVHVTSPYFQKIKIRLIILLLFLNLESCGFQAIYKDDIKEVSDFSYEKELAAIRIQKKRTKLDQDLKNNLYDALNPDYVKVEPKYFLKLTVNKTVSSTFITSSGASGRNRVILNVEYQLYDLNSGDAISQGSALMNDNYDATQNRFGTYVADDYVVSNLTKSIAKNIRNSLVSDLIELNKKKKILP